MATGPPSEDWAKTFNTLKEFHDSAYVKLDEGIKLESEGKKDVALSKYEEGLRLMDLALELRIECPANADLNWEKACVMLQKLRKTRKEVLSRIADVQVVQPQPMDPGLAPPPTYEEAMSLPLPSTSGNPSVNPTTFQSLPAPTRRPIPNCGPMTYSELGDALSNLKVETNLQSAQVLCTFENVRIYFIHPDGTVSAPSEPSTLRVLQLEDGADEVAKYFLQVGEWFYPLIPDVSPCLRTSYGAYILPDVTCEQDGAAVGLILPSDTDESMSELLQDLLHTDVAVEDETPPLSPSLQRDDSTSAKVAKGLITGEHKHRKKFLLKHGRHRRHRHKESDSSTVDRTEDENYDENFKKHRHGRRHRGHHGHRHRGRYDSEGNIYGEPPPYDEIGEEAKTLGNKEDEDEEDVEEIAGVEVDDSERSSKHYGRGKYSKRHKRHINSDRSGFSAKIDRGANFISRGLIRGAERTSQYLNSATPKLLERVTPDPVPRQVSPTVAKGVKVAKDATGTAVAVSGYVAGKLGTATMALGRYLAPHIQKQGTRLLTTASGMDEKTASERVGGMLQVAAGAVEGFGTVYAGLEESASILGKSLSDNTVQVVQHKYGQPMGEVAGDSFSTMGNVLAARQNAKFFTPRGFVKGTARGAGRAMIYEDQLGSSSSNNNNLNGSSSNINLNGNAERFKSYLPVEKPGSPKP